MHEIRNIAFTGQSGSGKTTLIEQLLIQSGTLTSGGDVEHGTTVSDFSEQEKRIGHSLESTSVYLNYKDHEIHLIDTPGAPDFIGRAYSIFPAVETVATIVDAHNGIDLVSEKMMAFAQSRQKCRLIIVNKVDQSADQIESLLEQIQQKFGSECLPINMPSLDGEKVVDCYFEPDYDTELLFSTVSACHDSLVDQVVEVDEDLMAKYLEQGEELTADQLHDPFESALRDQHLIPVCFTSAKTGAGIDLLLKILSQVMPDPSEGNPPLFLNGEKPALISPDKDLHLLAHVFKISIDPFMGRLAFIRVHQGILRPDMQLFIGENKKSFKTGHLFKIQGKSRVEISEAKPGDICAIPKVEDLQFDDVIHDSHDEDHFHLKSISFPPSMYGLALEPVRTGDEQKMSDSLRKLCDEDPSLRVVHKAALNETVLEGIGEIHLKIALEKLAQQFHLEVKTSQPSIDYRETISTASEASYRHKKQSGGSGQFGEVHIKIAPRERGEGFKFNNKIVGGAIPGQFISSVEKGVQQAMEEGVVAGFPVVDVEVSLIDGKTHSVDSKDIAFVSAGRKAFQLAALDAKPTVLEPIVEAVISCHASLMGDITGDIASHRGIIVDTDSSSGTKVKITAKVPQSEMNDYAARIKSITSGEGSFTLELSHYDPVPKNIQSGFQKMQHHAD